MPEPSGLEKGFTNHPIQLEWIGVKELRFKAEKRGVPSIQLDPGTFGLTHGRNEYDPVSKQIMISVKGEIGEEDLANGEPFYALAELVGLFKIDESQYPVDKILPWADYIAPLVLYPYLREHIYGLTMRAGFSAVVLPVLNVPTLKQAELQFLKSQEQKKAEASLATG